MEGFGVMFCFLVLAGMFAIETTVDAQRSLPTKLIWVRPTQGQVPDFAVVGGTEASGEPLYIARASINGALIPGKMNPGYKKAYVANGKYENEFTNDNYWILTNPRYSTHLKWVQSSGSYKPLNAVVGGYENGNLLYVARETFNDGHFIPGKASYSDQRASFPHNGFANIRQKWEVLTEEPRVFDPPIVDQPTIEDLMNGQVIGKRNASDSFDGLLMKTP